MYVNSLLSYENKIVNVIGKIEKIDSDIVFIRSGNSEIMVKHNGLDSYKTTFVRVQGVVENGVLREQTVHRISDEFDINLYNRFVDINSQFTSMF